MRFLKLMPLIFSFFVSFKFFITLWDFCELFIIQNKAFIPSKDDPLDLILSQIANLVIFIFVYKVAQLLSNALKHTFLQPFCRMATIYALHYVLELFITQWKPINGYNVWNFHVNDLDKLITVVKILIIIMIFTQAITLDIAYMLGNKQLYNMFAGKQDPLKDKSNDLKRLLTHLPHPVLLPVLLLWFNPVMRLDQFVLACGFTALATQVKVDNQDVIYVEKQMGNSEHKFF